jgi:hypothetical protein
MCYTKRGGVVAPNSNKPGRARSARAGPGVATVSPTAFVSVECSPEILCRRVRQGATRCARAAAAEVKTTTHKGKLTSFFFFFFPIGLVAVAVFVLLCFVNEGSTSLFDVDVVNHLLAARHRCCARGTRGVVERSVSRWHRQRGS